LSAAVIAALMAGAVIASHSRSGTLGLFAVLIVGGCYAARRRPAVTGALALGLLLALPLVPGSYWERVASITDESKDQSGSRAARSTLMREGWSAFLDRPLTGVGAGQFKNYNPQQRQQAWDETHNVVLQIGSELGILGLFLFSVLVARALGAGRETRRLLRRLARGEAGTPANHAPLSELESKRLEAHAAAATVAVVGWLVCGMFASVAYNWTLYYLLALATMPRELLLDRVAPRRRRSRLAAQLTPAAVGNRA
jgi:O-antigen ligase